ncbi:MAG: porphobilinogen synthase [Saprospiraceae bacterium]|jgi:porphobilinogen synthase
MIERPRRNRKSAAVRAMVRETSLSKDDLMYPLFLMEGTNIKKEVASLPGNYIWSQDTILKEIESCMNLGLRSFVLFPKVAESNKDKVGTYGADPRNFYLTTATKIKKRFPECVLMSDVALDPYSIDGHDGIVADGKILNDETIEVLQDISVAQAEAGFDILGPSDMMDGRVGAMREALDDSGHTDTSIMSYTAKYASGFYGPFRDALDSTPVDDPSIPKDKKTYQMDPANKREALIEADLDTAEGADFLMVKPAVHYMDIIHLLKDQSQLPIAAYHVSGECAMLTAAAWNGWLDLDIVVPETLLSLKRAGADIILTYFAKMYAEKYAQ